MATKFESDYPTSPTNDESEGEGPDSVSSYFQEEVEDQKLGIPTNNVENVLKKLHSLGAIVKKPTQEFRCYTCVEDFPNWEELENHLIQHVSLPSVVLDKLPSDDEDTIPSGDERWSDEEETQTGSKPDANMAGQKIDISQILKKSGISIKKPVENKPSNSDSALSKLSGLGFTIKKNLVPIKTEKPEPEQQNAHDVMQKLGKLGGIKLTLKSDGNNTNTFKVINGLKDFKTSDDEDEGSGNEESKDDPEGEMEEEQEQEKPDVSEGEQDFPDEQNISEKRQNSESDGSEKGSPLINKKIINAPIIVQGNITPKLEPVKIPTKPSFTKPPQQQPIKPPGRPVVKQTPKRGANLPITVRESPQQVKEAPTQGTEITTSSSTPSRASFTPERRESRDINTENIVVKQEVDSGVGLQSSSMPLFSSQIKTERYSPPVADASSTPIIARVKSEPDMPTSSQPILNQILSTSAAIPLLPVTKKEDTSMTIIEINGDSNDEDDDCCVVSATPAPDIKPVVPKTETAPSSYPAPASYPSSQPSYSSAPVLSSRMPTPSTEKQHNFNWNAPDSKPAIDILEKSADDIFESLLSSATKKENNNMSSISEVSEYISLDTLGPQHSCDVCNTRFTDIMLLEEHRIASGHSKTLVAPSSSTLLPYNPSSSNILSSLLPVKQLAEQVGKLSGMGGSGPGFTHQQNVMINIQAYPGGSGVMVQPPPYPSYPPGQNMHPGFPQSAPNNMFGAPGQPMPGQYPPQNYMGQQFQSPMSKAGYHGSMPPNSYSPASVSSPYSSASPLQSMQQSIYGQSTGFSSSQQQMGQMGPPASSPSHPYAPASSPGGSMKPPTSASGGIRIQNVQTFPPGQLLGANGQPIPAGSQVLPGQQIAPGQVTAPGAVGGQLPSPNQIRMAAGANVAGPRPRMASVRGARPSIRPGIQVHGQVRGAKPGPRMPMKRPAGMMGGPGQKRRPDVLLPGKHDNEDCQVMSMQKQRDGVPMIQSVQGAKDRLNLGSQISITKKTVNKEANAMANVLASRGISVKQKQKSRSPTPERPVPHIPNLGAGVSIKHTSKSSNFSIPEAKVGGGMLSCKICKKMFMNHNSLSVHMFNAHPQNKIPVFKCDECPASYPKSLQLQHHKRVFHNVAGPNRELGLPVVDLSQEENLKRLSNLGIHSFIPLANREQASGCFGIPVISVHNAQNGMTNSLQALGADGLLSLGPLKPLPNS